MGHAALHNKKMCMVIGHLGLRRAHALQADVCTGSIIDISDAKRR